MDNAGSCPFQDSPGLNVPRLSHATVCVGNKIYVLGGALNSFGGKLLQSVEYFDDQTRAWHFTCDIPSPIRCHTAICYKYFIYVFGGFAIGSQNEMTTRVLDTVSQKWLQKANMPEFCTRGSSVVYQGRIYVLGGIHNCCMSYNPDQDEWETHSKPAVNHDRPSAVVWKDRILLCGGTGTSVIEEYNPDTDTWSKWKCQLPQMADYPAVFAVQM